MTHERIIPLIVELKGDGVDTCIVCGHSLYRRASHRPNVAREIHIVNGGAAVAHPDYEYTDTAADLGWHSIGPECARMFPPGWTLHPVDAYRHHRLSSR